MELVVVLVIGGVLGWLASFLMRTDTQQGITLNVVVGVAGALLGGLLLSPIIGGAPVTSGILDLRSVLMSLFGAIILLAILSLARRARAR